MTSPDSASFPDPQRAWVYRPAQPLQTHDAGPLAGLTFSVKDLYGVPGWPLTASTRAPVPDPGASVLVGRLLELGAAALGKTHLHEVALGITGMNGYGGTTHPRDVRVGLWLPEGWTDETVRDAVLAYADDLKARGATVTPVDLPEMLDAYSPIVLSEAARVHAEALQQPDPGFLPFTLMSLRNGAALSEEEVQAAHERRTEYRVLLDRLLAEFDVLLAPAVPTPPPLIGQDEVTLLEGPQVLRRAVLRLNTPFSLLGAPVLSLPSSVPDVGVQLVGRHGQDERLLGLGLSLES